MENANALALKKLKLLISLAQIDGAIAAEERQFVLNLGKANGLSERDVDELLDRFHALVVPEDLSDDERFVYLLSMVQLMKADDKMFKEELLFCKKMAEVLGYRSEVLVDMLLHVTADMSAEQEQRLKEKAKQHRRLSN